MSLLSDRLDDLPQPDEDARVAVATRAAAVLRPPGALAWLDDVATWKAGWQRTSQPTVERPAAIVFAGDHGITTAANVSAFPAEVTAEILASAQRGMATINAFAKVAGASVTAIDVGVGRPTGDIRIEAAVSPERFDEICEIAFEAVDATDADLLVFGEMGIGNTTPSAAVAAALGGGEAAMWVGRGTGVDDDGLDRKREAVQAAVRRIAGIVDPLEILREVGGSELIAMAAGIIAARQRSIPVILDGYVVTAATFPLHVARPGALDHCIVGHCSAEPGHRILLEKMDKKGLLELDMRLGEGSGAMAAVPLVAMACAGVTQVATFDEWAALRAADGIVT